MILPRTAWRVRAGLDRLLEALGSSEGQVRAVGGAVRDTLLGLPVTDIDLATVHPPEETARRIAGAGFKAVPTGIVHGTITAVLPDGPIEVTTLRRDVVTDGRHAEIAFTDDWQADAARRDFTINALSADPVTGEVHDYFGGLADLDRRHVRFIGDPLARIAEDHLRLLRFFRFHARFGQDAPDAAALAACTARANDLMALSRERIAQELLKLLAVDDPVPTVTVMLDHAILKPVIPEITREAVTRLAALTARERSIGDADPLRRLAALLPRDPAIAEAVAVRLKLSKAQRQRLALAANTTATDHPRRTAYAIGVGATRDRLLLAAVDENLTNGLAMLDDWIAPRLPFKGGDLIALGLTAGPAVAAALQRIERRWIDEGFPTRDRVEIIAREELPRS